MTRSHASLLALSLGLLVAGTCAVTVAFGLSQAETDHATATAIRTASDERAAKRSEDLAEMDVSYTTAFDPAMVRDRVVWRMNPRQRPTIDLTVVNATPEADLAATARACATWGARRGHDVQCYVFASTEAYEYKNITKELPTGAEPTAIVNLCWAMLQRAPARGKPTLSDMRLARQTWTAQGCPESWPGTGPKPDLYVDDAPPRELASEGEVTVIEEGSL